MDDLRQDVRFALRAIRRAPVFSAVAILCLAVAIGINAAAFSVLDAFLFRDYPGVARQRELNTILIAHDFADYPGSRSNHGLLSPVDWEAFRGGIPAFASSSVTGIVPVPLRVGGEPIAMRGDFVSGDYFRTLSTHALMGRLLDARDDAPGAPLTAVISYDYWQQEFSGRNDVLGRAVHVGDIAFTIVGVAPQGFVGVYLGEMDGDKAHGSANIFMPLSSAPLVRAESRYAKQSDAINDQWLLMIGHRAAGASEAQVVSQATAIATRIQAAHPKERGRMEAVARTPSTASTEETLAGVLFVMAVPVLILMVACANLANQLLARGIQRSGEIAVRLSLGATRSRIVRLLLVETTILAGAAAIAGLGVARVLTDVLGAVALVLPFRIPIDLRVFAFTALLALATALLFGLLPALRTTRLDLARIVNEGGKSGGYQRSRLRNALVVVQVAVSVVLLALSGVFVRAAQRGRITDTFNNADKLLTVSVDLDLLGYDSTRARSLLTRGLERFRALPNVEAVAVAPFSPLTSMVDWKVSVAGEPPDRKHSVNTAPVMGDWFGAWNIRPLEGRLFTDAELRGPQNVVVVDRAFVSRFWPGQRGVGQTFRYGDGKNAGIATVIGVIPTIERPNSNTSGVIIAPSGGYYRARSTFYVRAHGNAAELRQLARGVLRELDSNLPLTSVETLGESLDSHAQPIAQIGAGMRGMGFVALLLAALGLAGVLAFVVEQRRYEIGVRMALGAESRAITGMILKQSLTLALVGIATGGVIAAGVAIAIRSILFGLPPLDPVAFSASALVMFAVAVLASVVPARRASRVDPMIALRAN